MGACRPQPESNCSSLYSAEFKNEWSRTSSPLCTIMAEKKQICVYTNWHSCPPNIQLFKFSEQLNCTRWIPYTNLFWEISRKKYSKMYFLQVRPSNWAEHHKDGMFYQLLKYRYNGFHMSLYIDRSYDDLWISMNVSDIFTMASRTRRSHDGCRRSCI